MWRFDSDTDPGYWVRVDSPTNVTLRDLTSSVNGPVAVGDTGVAIGRGRERWGVILENGPGAKGRALYAVDTTDDGKRVWFAGAGGALGYYDTVSEERRDYSVPRGNANSFYSLAVAGERGSEKFLVGDGAGNVLPGHMERNETDWSWATTPSGDNAVQALAHDDDGYGYGVTANANVFMTTTDEEWERIGVDGAQNSFYDCTFGDGVFLTGGGGGMLYEAERLLDHDDEVVWTPTALGGFAVYGTDAGHGAQLACGEGGNVYVRMDGGDWEQGMYDHSTTFRAGLVDEQMVAVGGNGLVVERRSRDELTAEQLQQYERSMLDGDEGGRYVGRERGSFAEEGSSADREEPADDETGTTRRSHDGDRFTGRGELYDGDGVPPETFGESDEPADDGEAVAGGTGDAGSVTSESDGSEADGNSGNDPPDAPDPEDNDPPDPPDGVGNDVAGEPGNDRADGLQNDVPGDPGNDRPDPPDEDTDSDADSPDSSPDDSDADSPDS